MTPLPTARAKPNHFVQAGKANPELPSATRLSEEMAADADAITLERDFIASEAEEAMADEEAAFVVVAVVAVAATVADIV